MCACMYVRVCVASTLNSNFPPKCSSRELPNAPQWASVPKRLRSEVRYHFVIVEVIRAYVHIRVGDFGTCRRTLHGRTVRRPLGCQGNEGLRMRALASSMVAGSRGSVAICRWGVFAAPMHGGSALLMTRARERRPSAAVAISLAATPRPNREMRPPLTQYGGGGATCTTARLGADGRSALQVNWDDPPHPRAAAIGYKRMREARMRHRSGHITRGNSPPQP